MVKIVRRGRLFRPPAKTRRSRSIYRVLLWCLVIVASFRFASATVAEERTAREPLSLEGPSWQLDQPPLDQKLLAQPKEQNAPQLLSRLGIEGGVSIGNWYDSNTILLGKGTPLPRAFKRKDDYQYGIQGDFSLSQVIPFADPERFPYLKTMTYGVGGSTSQLWHPNVSQFDRQVYAGQAFVNFETNLAPWSGRGLFVGAQYDHATTRLGRDTFVSGNKITPVLTFLLGRDDENPRWDNELDRLIVYYSYEKRGYQDDITDFRLDRDGRYQSVGTKYVFYLCKAEGLPYLKECFEEKKLNTEEQLLYYGHEWLRGHVGYEYRNEQTGGTEFDRIAHAVQWGLHVPLPCKWAFDIDGEFVWSNYASSSIFDFSGRERFDFTQHYNVGLTYTLCAKRVGWDILEAKLRAGVDLTFQNSNVSSPLAEEVFDYDRAVYGIQVELRWIRGRFKSRQEDIQELIESRGVSVNRPVNRPARPKTRVTTTLVQ